MEDPKKSQFELDSEILNVAERARSVGVEFDSSKRSASFLQVDQEARAYRWLEGIEVMSIKEAIEKYDWVKDYMWKIVSRDKDEYTKIAAEDFNGYFIRALPDCKIDIPVEACLYLKRVKAQKVYNLVVAEEGSELNIISGCTSHPSSVGMHIGVSEFFVKKGAKLTFTMIHNWQPDIEVRPRSGAVVEEDGILVSNYVLLSPVKYIESYPVAYLRKNAKAVFTSLVIAHDNSVIELGNKAILGEKSSADIISRAICKGGRVVSKGYIRGEGRGCKGHLECRGLMLSEKGSILAVPELEAMNPEVDLSHEAAVGRIAEEEIFYLMARGLTRDEATSAIIRGFLDVEIKGLPEFLKREIDKAIEMASEDLM
jgi:Fe-S cluster assembly scaffold protein SufB